MIHPNSRSAFFLFGGDKRPKLKQQNPGATVGEIAKQLGAAWKVMTDVQKKPYEEKAAELREKYTMEMAAYRRGEVVGSAKAAQDEDDEDDEDYSDDD
jgi:hypothetical protein